MWVIIAAMKVFYGKDTNDKLEDCIKSNGTEHNCVDSDALLPYVIQCQEIFTLLLGDSYLVNVMTDTNKVD